MKVILMSNPGRKLEHLRFNLSHIFLKSLTSLGVIPRRETAGSMQRLGPGGPRGRGRGVTKGRMSQIKSESF